MDLIKLFWAMIFSLLISLTSPPLVGGAGGGGDSLPPILLRQRAEITVKAAESEKEKIVSEAKNISIDMSYPAKSLISPYKEITSYSLITPHKEIFLEAKIMAKSGIKKIELNNKKIFTINDITILAKKLNVNNLKTSGKKNLPELSQPIDQNQGPKNMEQILINAIQKYKLYHLNQTYHLKDGSNSLDLLVEDNSGNKVSKQFKISNIPLDILFHNSRHRMILALVPLTQEAASEIDIQDYIYHKLLESFSKQARFNLVEKEKLPWLLIEKAVRTSDVSQKDIARQIGQITQADGIIFAQLQRMNNGIEILGRFVNVKTGTALFSQKVFAPIKDFKNNKDFEELNMIISGLAIKFRDSFPLCKGTITAKKGRIIEVSIGANEGIFPGMVYNIYYKDGNGLELISKAFIEEVDEDSSKARIPEGEKSWGIKVGYRVSTR